MKPHAEKVAGNLVFSADDGSVWAVWQIHPVPTRFAGDDERVNHHSTVARMLRGLTRPAMLLSACQPVTPSLLEVALRTGAVPSERLDNRIDDTILSLLEGGRTVYERTYWLTAQVRGGSGDSMREQTMRAAQSAWRYAARHALRGGAFTEADEVRNLGVDAAELEHTLDLRFDHGGEDKPELPQPGKLLARRATVGDIEWLTARLPRRGTVADLAVTDWDTPQRSTTRQGMMDLNAAGWAENWVDVGEGGPILRAHTTACLPDEGVSYQASFVVRDAPTRVRFPGGYSEWLINGGSAVAEGDGVFPVDWCVFVKPRLDDKGRKQVTSKLSNAAAQPEEVDQGDGVGVAEHVTEDIALLRELSDKIDSGDPRIDTVTWFTVAADSYDQLTRRVRAFRGRWSTEAWKLPRPIDEQTALVRASQPGAPLSERIISDFYRVQDAARVAAGMPFSGSEVGDPYGALVAVNLGDGLGSPVFFDPGYGIREQDKSGSVLFVGATGSGKSSTVKSLVEALSVRGSRFVAVDPEAEYIRLAEQIGGQVVDPYRATFSLDPLSIHAGLPTGGNQEDVAYDRERAVDATIGLISAVTPRGVEPFSDVWAALRRFVEHAIDQRARMVDVVRWISEDTSGVFDGIANPLAVASRIPPLASVFNPNLWPLSVSSPLTVIVLRDVQVPSGKGDATSEERQGLMMMQAAVHAAREAIYMDRTRYGAVILDEARALLATSYGMGMAMNLADRGRKRQSGLWLLVTDPTIDGLERFVAQADTRFLFRLESDDARRAARTLLGSAGADNDVPTILGELRNGECLFRDVRHRVSRVHMTLPIAAALNEAVRTTPTLTTEGVSA